METKGDGALALATASESMPSLKSLMQLKKKYDAPDVGSLPDGYKGNSDKERLYLWAADNFRRQIRHKHPTLKPLCLTSKNECGTEKLTMTFIRPTILPYSHLFNLDECAKFISDFLFYEPKEYEGTLWSPTYVLATQIGNSLEMSNILASFLIGFGFRAYVVCGWVDAAVSKMNRSEEKCPFLIKEDAKVERDTSHLSTKYTPKKPPELKSKYVQFLHKLKIDALGGKQKLSLFGGGFASHILPKEIQQQQEEAQEQGEEELFFHAWVYVDITDSAGFFLESTTGERKALKDPSYKSINSLWNHENYWLNKEADEEWKRAKSLDLSDNKKWIKFVCDMELPKKEVTVDEDGNPIQEDSPKRLLNNLHSWLMELVIPRDCFELMYRLGQKTSEFKNVTVEFFAPYLLKDGLVQRVTQLEDVNEKKEDEEEDEDEEDYEEEDLSTYEDEEEEEEEEEYEEATDDYEDAEDGEEADDKSSSVSDDSSKISKPKVIKEPTPEPPPPAIEEKLVIKRTPQIRHVLEKFRHRSDKMILRETFPKMDKVVERFTNGRKDRLMEHEFFKVGAAVLGGEAEDVSKYYSASRMDGLTKRVWKGMELIEEYVGRADRLIHMHAQFVQVEKKFGPAGDTGKSAREIGKIVETYEMHNNSKETDMETDETSQFSPGRILDTMHGIMERTYDIDGRRILLKFHREKGQIFCRTVEFFEPQERRASLAGAQAVAASSGAPGSAQPAASTSVPGSAGPTKSGSANQALKAALTGGPEKEAPLTSDDVKVYMVDPRDEKPCLRELSDIYKEHIELQKSAVKRVAVVEKEFDLLLESRMKELSANDMEVWVFDTKRNAHVQKGRLEQEQQIRKKEESILDLELDFLAPYFHRYTDITTISRAQAMEIRDECLANIKLNLEDKERLLAEQIEGIREEVRIKREFLTTEDLRSRKFMVNVLETRLARQKRETMRIVTQAEKKIKNDQRLVNIIGSSA